MTTNIQLLHHSSDLQRVLGDDGWVLEPEGDASFSARHPEVPDEVAARFRLYGLGLLTSASLRVEFGLPSQHR